MSGARHDLRRQDATKRRSYDKEAQRRKRLATLMQRYGTLQGGVHLTQIRMIVTPWFVDIRDGLPTRVVRAAAE